MDDSKHLIITVHGIRTFGHWQSRLKELLRKGGCGATVHNYRYGYCSALALLIPFFRRIAVRHFRRWLLHDTRSHGWTRIDITAHSYGTLLAAHALLGLKPAQRPRVHTMLFASSVLKPTFPWYELLRSGVKRVVNDCALHDVPLILSQWFVLGCGMAGRVGFQGMESEQLVNRYFSLGHSGYFSDDRHMRVYWIPVLTSDSPVESHGSKPKRTILGGEFRWLMDNADFLKLVIFAAIIVVPLVLLLRWRTAQRLTALTERARTEEQRLDANRQRLLAERRALNSLTAATAASALTDAWWDPDDQRAALLARQAYLLNSRNGLEALGAVDNSLRSTLGREPFTTSMTVGDVNCRGMAVSADGSLLAIAGSEQTLVFDLSAMSKPPTSCPTGTSVGQLAFDLLNRELLTATLDGKLSRFYLSNGSRTPYGVSLGPMCSLSRDGTKAAVVANGIIRVLSLPLATEIAAFSVAAEPRSSFNFRFSNTGKYLAAVEAGDENALVRVFNLVHTADAPITMKHPSTTTVRMAFAPDDSALFTGDGHGTIRTAVLTNGAVSSLGAVPGEIDSLEVGPDGQTVFVSTGTYVLSVDSRTGRYRWTSLSRYKYRMYSMAFAPRVNAVIAVDGLGNVQALSLDPPPTTPVAVPNHAGGIDHTGAIYFNIKLGQDGDILGFVGMDHVAIERLGRKQSVLSLDTRQIQDEHRSSLFAFAGEVAVAAGRTGILAWDLKRGIPARYIPIPGTKWLGVSADGAKLATATDNSINVLDLRTRNRIAALPLRLTGRRMPVVMAFSPDGMRLAWSDGPGGTHVATLQPGGAVTALQGLENVYCLAFDRSGRLLGAGAEDGKLGVWDLGSSGNPLTLFPGHDRGVISVAFDRTGGRVATGGADGRIKIWDLSKPAAQPTVLEAGSLPVTSVAFRPDGSVVAVNDSWDAGLFVLHTQRGPRDGSYPWLRAWPTTESLAERVCQKVWRNLTREEWSRYIGPSVPYEATCPSVRGYVWPNR